MRTRIKICGVTTLDALNACIDEGVDAVGFVFVPSPRRIDPRAAKDLIGHLPPIVTGVGVFKGARADAMLAAARQSGVAVIQADAAELSDLWSTPSIQALPVFRSNTDAADTDLCAAPVILFEGPRSGVGEAADWAAAQSLAQRRRVMLAGGLSAANVAEAIRHVRPFGVDTSSGVESSVGVKDPRLIRDFVRAVRSADQAVYGESA